MISLEILNKLLFKLSILKQQSEIIYIGKQNI